MLTIGVLVEGAFRYYGNSLLLLSAGLLLTVLMFSPWAAELDDRNLTFHMMGEHIGFSLGAILSSYGSEKFVLSTLGALRGTTLSVTLASLYSTVIRANRRFNVHGRFTVPLAAMVLVYWHVPDNFMRAVLDDPTHALMHLSYILLGVAIYVNIKAMSRPELMAYAVVLWLAMMVGGLIMIFAPEQLYRPYPLSQQREAGLYMTIGPHMLMLPLLVTYAFSRYVWNEPSPWRTSMMCKGCGQRTEHGILDDQVTDQGRRISRLVCKKCGTAIDLIPLEQSANRQSR